MSSVDVARQQVGWGWGEGWGRGASTRLNSERQTGSLAMPCHSLWAAGGQVGDILFLCSLRCVIPPPQKPQEVWPQGVRGWQSNPQIHRPRRESPGPFPNNALSKAKALATHTLNHHLLYPVDIVQWHVQATPVCLLLEHQTGGHW